MKNVLIIRSASFQQLDKNMAAIEKACEGSRISMLTHEHGVKLAEKYRNLSDIYVYPYVGGFRYGNKVRELQDKKFDTVIIPVTNISGAGFFNVMLFSLTLKTEKRVVCNLVSDMWEISTTNIFLTGLRNLVISGLSNLLSLLFGAVAVVVLPAKLRSLEKKD